MIDQSQHCCYIVLCCVQDGHDIFDLGETLYGFLLRYGDEFDVRRVSTTPPECLCMTVVCSKGDTCADL